MIELTSNMIDLEQNLGREYGAHPPLVRAHGILCGAGREKLAVCHLEPDEIACFIALYSPAYCTVVMDWFIETPHRCLRVEGPRLTESEERMLAAQIESLCQQTNGCSCAEWLLEGVCRS